MLGKPSVDEWQEIVRQLRLSGRECQVAQHLMEEKSHAEMSAELRISVNTVKTHVCRLYSKLAVTTKGGAITKLVIAHAELLERQRGRKVAGD